MYRTLGLSDSHLGMIILYTAVNLSLSVRLLKGFMDEIPREYEEAAMIGYSRFQAFWKVVLPQATTGIAATAIFCLIFASNEYAFALLLTSGEAQTARPSSRSSSARAASTGLPSPPAPPLAGRDLHRAAAPASAAARHHLWRASGRILLDGEALTTRRASERDIDAAK